MTDLVTAWKRVLYTDMKRPAIPGADSGADTLCGIDLGAPPILDFAPQFGFSWSPFKSNKTVIRGGAGMYWDSNDIWNHFREGGAIGPAGDGRTTLSAQSFTNIFPGIVNLTGTPTPIPVGSSLPLNSLTNLTLGQFIRFTTSRSAPCRFSSAPSRRHRVPSRFRVSTWRRRVSKSSPRTSLCRAAIRPPSACSASSATTWFSTSIALGRIFENLHLGEED